MHEYVECVGSGLRQAHEYLATQQHRQSDYVDSENQCVEWIDLVAHRSPLVYLNGANSVSEVNVKIVLCYGWAFREGFALQALKHIPSFGELLDSYML